MREIDGDMKTLVYENYSKFISATDTIRKMKSNVESMESEMGRLNENIHGIAQQCNNINQALEPNRTKIQQLGNVHNQLQRLQFIFELPNRLEKCLNSKHYVHAVKYYSRARKLLDHYQHMPAFKGIEKDCCSIMDRIKDELWIGLKQPDASTSKVNEYAKLLVLLKEDPEPLWNTYITVQLELISKNQSTTVPPDNAETLVTQYILPLEDVVDHFRSLFLSSKTKNGDSEGDTGSIVIMPSHDQERAKLDLLQNIQPFIDHIFDMVASHVHIDPLDGNEAQNLSQPLHHMQYLMDLQQALSTNVSSLSSVALIGERFNEFVASWQSNIIDTLMNSASLEMKSRIEEFSGKHLLDQDNKSVVDGNVMRGFLDDITIWFGRHMKKNCFLPLQACFQVATGDQQSIFLSRIQAGLKKMWMTTADQLLNLPETTNSSTVRIFMVSRLCYDFADHGVIQTYNDISALLFNTATNQNQNGQARHHYLSSDNQMDSALITDANFVMERYLAIGQQLLNDKMMHDGYQLSNDVQQCYLDYNTLDYSLPPTSVSSTWPKMLSRLKSLEHIMQSIFPQTSAEESWQHGGTGTTTGDTSDNEYDYRYTNGDDTYHSHDHSSPSIGATNGGMDSTQIGNNYNVGTPMGNGNSSTGGLGRMGAKLDGSDGNDMTFNMFNNIDKLFADRVDVYRRVDPSPLGICGGLVRILIKSFHETTRLLQIVDEHMYQQLQLDIEYIQHTLWSYTTDEK
ncbi:exocyst complex component Sec5-domain-containing protein [Absidia repens]|uniref:Vacuolar protein sorting-associated protein 51 homolog n=1 Tax=Absidia repens TaxID=90262 RepID=A0A1X2IS75_9FUNG|nr:exocyst complex component Sec5-domain-containing protein [Absidia repens]